MSCARMRRKILVDSVWGFFFLLIFVGLVTGLPTYAQEKSLQQDGQPAIPADELISLEIRDFDPWEHTEQSLYSTDLLRAVPDALYIYFLGYPRLGVSRGPSIPRATSAVPQAERRTAPVTRRPRSSSYYSLEGQIRLVSPGATGVRTGISGRGSQLLFVRYQVWLNPAGSEPEPKLIMEERDRKSVV